MLIRIASRNPKPLSYARKAASLGIRMLPASRYATIGARRTFPGLLLQPHPPAEIEPALHRQPAGAVGFVLNAWYNTL